MKMTQYKAARVSVVGEGGGEVTLYKIHLYAAPDCKPQTKTPII